MEMNFPHPQTAFADTIARRDFRALLSSAISRQASSPTARALIASSQNNPAAKPTNNEDMVAERIHYFAARHGRFVKEAAPHGAFLPPKVDQYALEGKNEQPVYQEASMNSKDMMLENVMSGTQAAFAGQENVRTI